MLDKYCSMPGNGTGDDDDKKTNFTK